VNFSRAVYWWEKAAAQDYVPAQHNLGVLWEEGRGVKRDQQQAVKWFTLAAQHGDSRSQYRLGKMYEMGQGAEQDYSAAYMWYTLSSRGGLQMADLAVQRLKQIMTPGQIRQATNSIDTWVHDHAP
jgi:TPR repeat protein